MMHERQQSTGKHFHNKAFFNQDAARSLGVTQEVVHVHVRELHDNKYQKPHDARIHVSACVFDKEITFYR